MTTRARWTMAGAVVVAVAVCVGGAVAGGSARQASGQSRLSPAEQALAAGLHQEEVEGNLRAAIAAYEKALQTPGVTKAQGARAQLHIGLCYERLGMEEARKAYEAVLEDYGDQADAAATARTRLAALGQNRPAAAGGPVLRCLWRDAPSLSGTDAALSPDGRFLAHVQGRDLVVRDLQSGGTRNLTAGESRANVNMTAAWPVWSQDGRKLAYWWWTEDGAGPSDLRVKDLETDASRAVLSSEGFKRPLLWSRDARQILTDFGDRGKVGWVSVADGSVRTIAEIGRQWAGPSAVQLSPDGRYLGYFLGADRPEGRELLILAADAGTTISRTVLDGDNRVLGWSPGSDGLLYVNGVSGGWSLWLLPVRDGKPQGEPRLLRESVAPPGSILGLSTSGALAYVPTPDIEGGIYLANLAPDGSRVEGAATRIADGFRLMASPRWSPDGKWLAYRGGIDRKPLYVGLWSPDTGQSVHFSVPSDEFYGNFGWTADSQWVVFGAYTQDGFGLYRLDVTSGRQETLVPPDPATRTQINEAGLHVRPLGLSPDGRAVYKWVANGSNRDPGNPSSIRSHPVGGGAETEIFRTVTPAYISPVAPFPAVSPDGRLVAFRWSGRLTVVPTSGGEARVLYESDSAFTSLTWSPDGRRLLFTTPPGTNGGDQEAWAISVDGGAPRKLGLAMRVLSDVTLHPDGRRVAFKGGQYRPAEVWMLENFLPAPKAP